MMPLQNMHDFYFEWPWLLALWLLIPLWWVLYVRHERGKWQQALRFSRVALVDYLQRQPMGWRRLARPMALSLMMALLVVALARPVVVGKMPVRSVDMMIVMDISLSMLADDVRPSRLEAARDAAVRFINSLPRDARVGLEVFAGDSFVLSAPTRNHAEVVAILRTLRKEDVRQRTELGSALRAAMTVMLPEDQRPGVPPVKSPPASAGKGPRQVIILLSDGDSHEGYPWTLAAEEARQAHITIHTVGVGHDEATSILYQGMELPVLFSETTLRRIAGLTGGRYFRVAQAADFRRVYDQIRERSVHYEERSVDVGFVAAGLALLLLTGLSLRGRGL